MKRRIPLIILFFNALLFSQENVFTSLDMNINEFIDGTLLFPNDSTKANLVIIIAGSGPTDRNGNQNFLKNNALKKLAEELSKKGIATFRYDKRVVKQIREGKIDKNIMFDDFVTDATSVINYFKASEKINSIYIIGHSQGSLVGMLAAKTKVDGFISIAGAGQPIDLVVIDQIEKTYTILANDAKRIFNILKEGKTTDDYPKELAAIFKKDVQLFLMNWMQYKPQEEIKKLDMPILIINGTKDLQVSITEADLLKNAKPEARLKLIENMNHIMVPIEGDNLENSKSYNEPYRKLSEELIKVIIEFIEFID